MSIATLKYVRCDGCGDPAQPGDDAKAARRIAAAEGFAKIKGQDLCIRCRTRGH